MGFKSDEKMYKIILKKPYLLSIFLLFQIICKSNPSTSLPTSLQLRRPSGTNADVWMNVFIHGIIKPPLSFGDIYKISQNQVRNTRYEYTVKYLREQKEIYLYQPMQELGLHKIDLSKKNGASALANLYDLQFGDSNKNLYYTFGWSAVLSRTDRQEAGINLLNELKYELEELKFKNIYPKIRLIGFSHGGNVILNMAKFINSNEIPITIDELILMATPIQKDTDFLINHPIFNKIYNIYSMSDIAQRADKFSTPYFFSHRKFHSRVCFDVPTKLTQIEVEINTKFGKNCTFDKCYNIGPQHMEFWLFGWAPKSYRKKFPINPLSIISLLPTMLNALAEDENLSNDLNIMINPFQETVLIKDNINKQKIIYEFPYRFESFVEIALKFSIYYPYCQHAELIKNAIIYAIQQRKMYKQQCKMRFQYMKKNILN